MVGNLYYRDTESDLPLLKSMGNHRMRAGSLLYLIFRKARKGGGHQPAGRHGMIVAVGWTAVGLVRGHCRFIWAMAAIYLCTDAVFESVSGFTTTGASILTNIEAVCPKGLLFWRSFIQWLGGMGIIVLSVAILAFSGGRRYAALQGGSSQSGSRQAQTPHPRYGHDPVESICADIPGAGHFADASAV